MRINKSKLIQIIKEETKKVLLEQSYPTEADLNYLASLGTDKEMSVPRDMPRAPLPYFRSAVSPAEAINLKQLGMDPKEDRHATYDPHYNPAPKGYRRRQKEKYVPLESTARALPTPSIESGARPEALIDKHMRYPFQPVWVPPEILDTEDPGPEIPDPSKGELFVRKNKLDAYFGTPHMKELGDSLKNVAGGGWYFGDISQEGGGGGLKPKHDSHQAGIDADIALPMKDGGMSVDFRQSVGPGQSTWKLRKIEAEEMDYDRTVEFLRKTAPRMKKVILNKKFFPGIKAKMDSLVKSGDMSPAEYKRIRSGVLRWSKGHEDHFHVRLRDVYPHWKDPRRRGRQKEEEKEEK